MQRPFSLLSEMRSKGPDRLVRVKACQGLKELQQGLRTPMPRHAKEAPRLLFFQKDRIPVFSWSPVSQIKHPQLVPQLKRLQHSKVVSSKIFHLPSFGRVGQGDPRLDNHVPGNDTRELPVQGHHLLLLKYLSEDEVLRRLPGPEELGKVGLESEGHRSHCRK